MLAFKIASRLPRGTPGNTSRSPALRAGVLDAMPGRDLRFVRELLKPSFAGFRRFMVPRHCDFLEEFIPVLEGLFFADAASRQ